MEHDYVDKKLCELSIGLNTVFITDEFLKEKKRMDIKNYINLYAPEYISFFSIYIELL